MSLKSVDMQISLSRTPETKNIQHQFNQKPVLDQSHLGQQAEKQQVEERHQSAKLQESAEMHIRDENREKQKKNGKKTGTAKEEKKADTHESSIHPYKGKNLDISL